jgi:hypothetical protein
MLAVIIAVPADFAVATPEASTVATAGALDVQVAESVTFWVVEG